MAFFNGTAPSMLTSKSAFASSLTNAGIVGHRSPIQDTANATDAVAHQYFAAVAKGDIIHFVSIEGTVSTTTTLEVRFRQIGSTTEHKLIDVGTTATSFKEYTAAGYEAPEDGLLLIDFETTYRRQASASGVFVTALISKPFLQLS